MCAAQGKGGGTMLKSLHTPELLIMATGTLRQLPPVHIILSVALATILPHTSKLATIFMTLTAFQRFMNAY